MTQPSAKVDQSKENLKQNKEIALEDYRAALHRLQACFPAQPNTRKAVALAQAVDELNEAGKSLYQACRL